MSSIPLANPGSGIPHACKRSDDKKREGVVPVICNSGAWIEAPADFIKTSAGELWEELHFLGAATVDNIADFLGRSRCATARMLTRLRSYGLVEHEEILGEIVYRALGFENLNTTAVKRQRSHWKSYKQKIETTFQEDADG